MNYKLNYMISLIESNVVLMFPDGSSREYADGKDPLNNEYLLSVIADGMLKDGIEFTVLPSNDKWFGVTYVVNL